MGAEEVPIHASFSCDAISPMARIGKRGESDKKTEIVEFPMQNIRRRDLVLYCEDELSKLIWDSHPSCRDGVVEVIENNLGQTCLSTFYEADGSLVRDVGWGTIFEGDRKKKTDRGIWLLASSVPHVRCWQSPNTYGELREWAKGKILIWTILSVGTHLR